MRKKLVAILCGAFLGVFLGLFSCSDLALPKNLEIQGTLDLPISAGTSTWGSSVTKTIEEMFTGEPDSGDSSFDVKVYDVNFGQYDQTFLINLHSEMTNPLNPDDYFNEVADVLYVDGKDSSEYKIEKKFEMPEEIQLTLPITISSNVAPGGTVSFSDLGELDLKMDSGFLHAIIKEGDLKIGIEVNGIANSNRIKVNNISITQTISSYSGSSFSGLSYSSTGADSLDGKELNNNKIKISSIELVSQSGLTAPLTARLTVKMNIKKLKEVDWDFTKIKDDLNHQISPLSLSDAAQYVNYIEYDQSGIGLKFYFDKMVNGLGMSVECPDLDFDGIPQPLTKGKNIIFGNKDDFTLWLNHPSDPSKNVRTIDFDLVLQPSGSNKNVLNMDFGSAGIAPGELGINGTASFFQNWIKAEINMASSVNAKEGSDAFTGQIPAEDEGAIDLSALADYIEGFTFKQESVKSKMYLSGPNKAIKNVKIDLLLSSSYGGNITEKIYDDELKLDEKIPSISANDIDARGSYIRETLPAGGKEFPFLGILNTRPADLAFIYEIKMPPTLIVTPDMFKNTQGGSAADSNITITIIIMLSLQLHGPGTMSFPDMFDENKDLFGRNSPGPLIESIDLQYIKITFDFIDSLFSGGDLFIEKFDKTRQNYQDKMLFPNGVALDGKRITMNAPHDIMKKMEKNLIYPDVKVHFGADKKLNVPRNMGVTGIKFEVKGNINIGDLFE